MRIIDRADFLSKVQAEKEDGSLVLVRLCLKTLSTALTPNLKHISESDAH